MIQHRKKNYLRSCRVELGLYQRHLGLLLGASRSRVSKLENGLADPTVYECVVFRLLFHCNFDDLWPRTTESYVLRADALVRRLMERLERVKVMNEYGWRRASLILRRLETLLYNLPPEE